MIPDRYTGVSGSNPGPVEGLLASLDVRLRRATLLVAGCRHIGDGLIYGAQVTATSHPRHKRHGPRKIIPGCMER